VTPLDKRADACEAMLRRWCADHGVRVLPDDSICEREACLLCGFTDRSALAQRIREGLPVPRFRTTGTRRFFRLHDIAVWLELGYDESSGF
jgi:hypothetical protein